MSIQIISLQYKGRRLKMLKRKHSSFTKDKSLKTNVYFMNEQQSVKTNCNPLGILTTFKLINEQKKIWIRIELLKVNYDNDAVKEHQSFSEYNKY